MKGSILETVELEELAIPGYASVIKAVEPVSGLQAIISQHDLRLGPALGGTRIYPYGSFEEALEDVLRLSKGMTYKSAISGCGWGGGKSVIMLDRRRGKTPELLKAFAEALNLLKGAYICAEDIGCSPDDVGMIGTTTPYVVGLTHPKSSGNPAPYTALGTLLSMRTCAERLWDSPSLRGKRIVLQGVGSVGSVLVDQLFFEGAELIIADVDPAKVAFFTQKYRARPVSVDAVYDVPCDLFAPCAMGGVLKPSTIARLQCKAIAGCANNQLLQESDGDLLDKRNILYAPDFVANAGGLINVTAELAEEGYDPQRSRDKIYDIPGTLHALFDIAEREGISTHQAAVALGDERLAKGIGRRTVAPSFHHWHA